MMLPETKYARSGDVHIAFRVMGSGPIDLVVVPGWVTHVEYNWEEPLAVRFFERLSSFCRLIMFDKRGTGLSDRVAVWPAHLYPGARALLASLAPRFRLVSLSNTNAVHWQHVCHTLGLADCFQQHFPSHQTGRLKPDREAFEFVVQCLGAAPERMLFFDDNLANVETARSVGMHAQRVSGVSETIAALRVLQLIDVDAGPA